MCVALSSSSFHALASWPVCCFWLISSQLTHWVQATCYFSTTVITALSFSINYVTQGAQVKQGAQLPDFPFPFFQNTFALTL